MSPISGMDRLLPRHPATPQRVEVEWDLVRPKRWLRPRPEHFVIATVLNISLDGALLELPLTSDHDVNTMVAIRFDREEGFAVVRHRRPSDAGTTLLYGVSFVGSVPLQSKINAAVAVVRGSTPKLLENWERER